MRKLSFSTAACALAAALTMPAVSQAMVIPDGPGSGTPGAYDSPHEKLSADWWTWALQYPEAGSPMLDADGSLAHLGNQGSVFFLAGSFGGDVVRNFKVPVGMPLFFPALNTISLQTNGDTEASLRQAAVDNVDSITRIYASIDDYKVRLIDWPALRKQSPVFYPGGELLPDFGLCFPAACPSSYDGMAVSDGYWLMVQPLSFGPHVIKFGGEFADGTTLNVIANINAVPEPGVYALMLAGLGVVGWVVRRRNGLSAD